jgi:hypothetical protein
MGETIGEGIVDYRRDGLTGISGWLITFMLWTGLQGVACIFAIAGAYISQSPTGRGAFTIGYLALVCVLTGIDVVLILAHKRFAKYLSIFFCGFLALMSGLTAVLAFSDVLSIPVLQAVKSAIGFIVSCLWLGYFLRSERVAYTLVK